MNTLPDPRPHDKDCPECGSKDTQEVPVDDGSVNGTQYINWKKRCDDCGNEWWMR